MKPFFFQIEQQESTFEPQEVNKSYPVSELSACACYGVFHEPTTHFVADHAVLFLYPWGQEYVRSHRGIRRLAMELQEKGIPSLRFDYRGTGDSGGSDQLFSIDSALEDAKDAMSWLLETTGARQVKVFAVRLGSLIALNALASFEELTDVICWDPILDGQQYLNELSGPHITSRLEKAGMTWVNGYPISPSFHDGLAKVKAHPQTLHANVVIYGAPQTSVFKKWIADREESHLPYEVEHAQPADTQSEWGTVNTVGGFVNPTDILNTSLTRLIQH